MPSASCPDFNITILEYGSELVFATDITIGYRGVNENGQDRDGTVVFRVPPPGPGVRTGFAGIPEAMEWISGLIGILQ